MKKFFLLFILNFIFLNYCKCQTIYEDYESYFLTKKDAIFKKINPTHFDGIYKNSIIWQGKKFLLKNTIVFPGEFTKNDDLGQHALAYVNKNFLCFEGHSSSSSGTAVRHNSVYFIKNWNYKKSKIYKLPSLFSSCLSIEINSNNEIIFPKIDYIYENEQKPPIGVIENYYLINDVKFSKTNQKQVLKFTEQDNVWKFYAESEK